MVPVGFEPTISAGKRTQTYALDRAATGTDIYEDTESEMYDYTGNNWSHWKLKEIFGSCARETFDRFTTHDSYTWNSTHSTESTAM